MNMHVRIEDSFALQSATHNKRGGESKKNKKTSKLFQNTNKLKILQRNVFNYGTKVLLRNKTTITSTLLTSQLTTDSSPAP